MAQSGHEADEAGAGVRAATASGLLYSFSALFRSTSSALACFLASDARLFSSFLCCFSATLDELRFSLISALPSFGKKKLARGN